jgi:tetratricopeptide (TPR) repeat protein
MLVSISLSPRASIRLAEKVVGNPVVQYAPVTLSNHTILRNPPYNCLVQRAISESVNRHGRMGAQLVRELPPTGSGTNGAGVRTLMAFGFGFNKQKVLSAAEKFVQQGKVPNAITEYEKVLKADPKDLTVANTVGDLYVRLGENDKAVECFKSVGDAYATQGFTVKAIAMYKKLSKIKPSLESVLRLAELYTQQGLFNDARAQYLQVAEEFLKAGELEQAVRIFQKTLEMDPENVPMRTRLAEVYVRLNKKTEAWQIFAAAAESLRNKGQLEAAENVLERMLTLDPGNSQALLMRGKTAIDAGDAAGAIKFLEKVADLDSNPEGLRGLFQAYLQSGRLAEAGTLATKLLSVHNDPTPIHAYADALVSAGQYEEALKIYNDNSDRLLSADEARVLESLHTIIGHVRENSAALETLLALFQKAGENTHLTEIYELLAHAYVQSGDLEKARDYYLKLTQLEPQNHLHAQNYQQVVAKLGGTTASRLITAEEGAVLVEELEATAPFIDQRYDDETALAVRAALTDAELFISYNMPAKALGPLLSALPKASRDLRLNQRLVALHTRAGRFAEAGVCSGTLESIYHDAGHPDEASRYAELAAKYEERASVGGESAEAVELPAPYHATREEADEPVAPLAKVAAPIVSKTPVAAPPAQAKSAAAASGLFFHAQASAAPPQEAAEFEVQAAPPSEEAIDLSGDWEAEFSDDSAPAPVAAAPAPVQEPVKPRPAKPAAVDPQLIAETVEEVRFYLAQGMPDEARAALAKLSLLKADANVMAELHQEIDAATAPAPVAAPPAPVQVAEVVDEAPVVEAASAPAPVEVEPEPEVAEIAEPEITVEVEEIPEPEAPKPAVLDEFVADLETSLGDEFLPATPTHAVAPTPEPEPQIQPEPETVYAEISTPTENAGALGDFVSDLEASLGDGFLAEAPAAQEAQPPSEPIAAESKISVAAQAPAPVQAPVAIPAPAAMAAAAPSSAAPAAFTYQPTPIRPLVSEAAKTEAPKFDAGAGVDLADMFGELKHELEEDVASSDEDPETHYNLGVAFREMGLLDEAIGELQKVCQAVDHGHAFPQVMQTYTWLAQCFLDKGVPEAAIRWYEKALKLPQIDQETRTALHYELASSYEVSGNKQLALSNFMEVYGSNIDYRDVAERIKALKS